MSQPILRPRSAICVDNALRQQIINGISRDRLVGGKNVVKRAVLANNHDHVFDRRDRLASSVLALSVLVLRLRHWSSQAELGDRQRNRRITNSKHGLSCNLSQRHVLSSLG